MTGTASSTGPITRSSTGPRGSGSTTAGTWPTLGRRTTTPTGSATRASSTRTATGCSTARTTARSHQSRSGRSGRGPIGDVCDNDDDGDYSRDNTDNCPRYPNPDQLDADSDKRGAACDDNDTPPAIRNAGADPDAERDRRRDRPPAAAGDGLDATSYRVAEVADGLIVRIRCSEACTAKAEVTVSKAVARSLRLRGTTVVGTGTVADRGRDEHVRVRPLQFAESAPGCSGAPARCSR